MSAVAVETYETRIGPRNGARVVARAWLDPGFRDWLLRDATAAIASLGYHGLQGEHMVAVANTPQRHNLVVCTLCSCYPWPVLGLPPTWYKSAPYRARAVRDPRGVLAEFGVSLSADTEIRVWDSTAETRFMVLPLRPPGTEALLDLGRVPVAVPQNADLAESGIAEGRLGRHARGTARRELSDPGAGRRRRHGRSLPR